jgi:hypothetical protein
VFEERHHFDPPHRIEPERLANSLKTLWGRAERSRPSKPQDKDGGRTAAAKRKF